MRFLLLIESLEGYHDYLYKDDLEQKNNNFKKDRDAAISFLNNLPVDRSDDSNRHIRFIKKNLFMGFRMSLSLKLKKLFQAVPSEAIGRMLNFEIIEKSKANNDGKDSVFLVCNALGNIRNSLSHGDDKAYINDFPLLVNALEGVVQYFMLLEIGFNEDDVEKVLVFSGFPHRRCFQQ
ncbi:HEPN domain-containing protein [Bifidobacterium samirii]|uniref:HEPN domain-containing protein n=1 Tax=Bifidobacterium samirii TaxID=2306974 RepID=UPI000F7D80B3|nr:HEPN domain-containing protein [Bifidobacterium samirii]